MCRTSSLLIVFAALAAPAAASVTTTVDLVDPSDGITQPPPGIIAVDVLVDVSDADVWTAGGTRVVVTAAGAIDGVALLYAPISDPNHPATRLLNPGTQDRFITFLSRPRDRDSDERFISSGAVIGGTYSGGAYPRTYPYELNVSWFRSPPANADSPSVDGATARVAIDVSTLLTRQPGAEFKIGHPADATGPIIVESLTHEGMPGTVSISFDNPEISGLDWAVWYIPEPASIALILVGAVGLRRR